MRHVLLALLVSILCACTGERVPSVTSDAGHVEILDGGAFDAARPDGSQPDASMPVVDGGAPQPDAASSPPDASVPYEAQPMMPCIDTINGVYVMPSSLPGMTDEERGAVVRCAPDETWTQQEVQDLLDSKLLSDVTATSGTNLFRIAFRSWRSDGRPAISTALVYLPTTPRRLPLPRVVIGHPTSGMADQCAVSNDQSYLNNVAVPWAARGFAVIVPDHAGLGNEGVLAYLDNVESAHMMLDGARALQRVLGPGASDARILLAGYSQGGGSVLSAQALEDTYGTAGVVVGVLAWAPQWPTRFGSFGYSEILRNPSRLTITTGVSKCVIAVMRQYAWFANTLGEERAAEAFPDAERTDIVDAINSQCFLLLGGHLQANQPRLGELVDPALAASLIACEDNTPGCDGVGAQFHAWLQANVLDGDPTGAPILYVQGLSDQILPASEEAACNVAHLRANNTPVTVCTDSFATHANVIERNVLTGMGWGEARILGMPELPCEQSTLPACAP